MRNFLILFAFLLVTGASAQTQLFYDDFEAWTVGLTLVSQDTTDYWTTWSGAAGNSEDPEVLSIQAYEGSNSAKVLSNNDLVLLFNDKTTGRYKIDFRLYVVSSQVAYFNLLQDFAGSNSQWGMQTFFNVNGTATVDAGGESMGTFSFVHDSWMHIELIVDLDDDFASMFVDDAEVVSWKWSGGSYGTGTLNKLDAANFYGWVDDSVNGSEYYLDNVSFIELNAADYPTPLNLTTSVSGNDISVDWNEPATGTPSAYLLMRNGEVTQSNHTATEYSDLYLYPNTYEYQVRALYGTDGYSSSSNLSESTVEGGITRNSVLYEIGTGTWCVYCPGAAMGADDLVENEHDVAIIEYHSGDTFAIDDGSDRIAYYSMSAFPTTEVDGKIKYEGGNATQSLYPSFLVGYENRIDVPSIYDLTVSAVENPDSSIDVSVSVEETNGYFTNGLKLRAALIQSHIPVAWQNQSELNFVCRQMFPDEAGVALDFSGSSIHTENYSFSLDSHIVKNNCEFIVFVQHDPTKEVIQVAKIDLSQVSSVDEVIYRSSKGVYPNPAREAIFVAGKNLASYSIYSVTGTLMKSEKNVSSARINIEKLPKGTYIIIYEQDGRQYSEKFIKMD
ncbi:MAG: hypothetical protein C0594_10175 [Marinilabiliales bacterium]|nr:MAG: hypothetical protein C0594_10175 [Marinilabiliales bacterium]